jgi:hypothetical protein
LNIARRSIIKEWTLPTQIINHSLAGHIFLHSTYALLVFCLLCFGPQTLLAIKSSGSPLRAISSSPKAVF